MAEINKLDLGAVSAYALAVEQGYTGTEEEFATLMAQSGENAQAAEASKEGAEAWAVGQRGGEDVPDTDPTYHNNAKYYAEQAGDANTAAQGAKTAAQEAAASASAAYGTDLLAPNFVEGTANDPGSYVIYSDGKMYLLPDGHTAGATWANTNKIKKDVGGELSDVKSALDNSVDLSPYSTKDIWSVGNITRDNGENSTSTTRMRTSGYIPDNVMMITATSGNLVVYAYNNGTYVGIFDPATGTFSTTLVTSTSVNLNAQKVAHPEYKYRVVWYLSSSHDIVISSDYVNIKFVNDIVVELSKKLYTANLPDYIDLDDQNVQSIWAVGNISLATGENSTSTTRMRTSSYISDNISVIMSASGQFMVYGYDENDAYLGMLNPSNNTFSKETIYSESFADLSVVKKSHPYYKYRVVWYLSSSHNIVIASDYSNVVFFTGLGYELSKKQKPLFGKNIVFMGDSIFGRDDAPDDIPTNVSILTNAKCYNCAFGGTRAVVRDSGTYKPFDLGSLVTAIISGDFTDQDDMAETAGGYYPAHLANLKSVDFSKVDIIILNYGTNDWYGNAVIGDSTSDSTTFFGAMKNAISSILAEYPKIRFVICTPLFRMIDTTPADDYTNSNDKTLTDFVSAVEDISKYTHAQLINNYCLGVNQYNYTSYYVDHTHPNKEMISIIANHIYHNIC